MHFNIYGLLPLFFKNRDRVTIVADILRSIAHGGKGKRKTRIMQNANLNYGQANKYLDLLLSNGYIILDGYLYKPTQEGLKFLENLEIDYLKLKYRI